MVSVLGTRNPNARIVFAHIYGYTQKNGAWEGKQTELADQVELPYNTVNDQINKLKKQGLIGVEGDRIWTIPTIGKPTRHSGDETRDSGQKALPLNNPPIKNQDKEVSMTTTTFEEFKSLFMAAHPDEKIWNDYAANAERKWNQMEPDEQRMILEQLRNGEDLGANPLFLLKDWKMPKPQWLTGDGHYNTLRAGKTVCICRDDSNPRVPRMRPIKLREALRHKLPCLRWEVLDEKGTPRSFDHKEGDSLELPVAKKIE